MSANQYRGELARKRKQRVDAEKKAASHRAKESAKRAQAAKARQSAARLKSDSSVQGKLREAERREGEAVEAGKKAAHWQGKAADYAKAETAVQEKLARAERADAVAVEKRRQREHQQAQRRAAAEEAAFNLRISRAETAVNDALRQLPRPKPEKLRVLMLGASSEGDLRVGREQKRIRAAVESALHRDQIELDVRPAATTNDLLDGLSKFRPHVVHFSGHSNDDLIVFECETDEPRDGVVVDAGVFARAIRATDDPPLLVLLNSCKSASQIDALVEQIVPFAIGMADKVGDADAINYAAQFYASVANGQSVQSAHLAGKVRLELDGLEGSELPTLAWADDVDPGTTMLVKPTAPPLQP